LDRFLAKGDSDGLRQDKFLSGLLALQRKVASETGSDLFDINA
jgi:hypothetical protein